MVFVAFSLRNVLRATAVCNFGSLIWLDGAAPTASASLLFDPLEPKQIGKSQCPAAFLLFRALWSSFFWRSLLQLFPPLLFHLSIIVESLTSKRPSIRDTQLCIHGYTNVPGLSRHVLVKCRIKCQRFFRRLSHFLVDKILGTWQRRIVRQKQTWKHQQMQFSTF